MPWNAPSLRTTGTLISAVIWNDDLVENLLFLKEEMDRKGYPLQGGMRDIQDGAQSFAPAPNTVYLVGAPTARGYVSGTPTLSGGVNVPKEGTITYARFTAGFDLGETLGSGETSTLKILLNGTTTTLVAVGLALNGAVRTEFNDALNIPVVSGDSVEFQWETPASWATQPGVLRVWWEVFIS